MRPGNALEATDVSAGKRIGFMDGEVKVPEDFDRMDAEEIERLFEQGE